VHETPHASPPPPPPPSRPRLLAVAVLVTYAAGALWVYNRDPDLEYLAKLKEFNQEMRQRRESS
jgi:hypothetical protein